MNCKDWLSRWHVTPSINQTYDFLDGIRGLAILMVIASHVLYVNPSASLPLRFLFGLFGSGALGVTVFFCLSGFLISLPFWNRKFNGDTVIPPNYMSRRFWKIYPPLLLSILLLTPVYIAVNGNAAGYWEAALKWITGGSVFMPVPGILNPVMWSLIVEVHFYAMLPLLFLAFRRLSYRQTLWSMFSIFLLIPPLARFIYAQYGLHCSLHPQILVNFPSSLDAFAFGILISGLLQAGTLRPSFARMGPIGLVCLVITLLASSYGRISADTAAIFNNEVIHYMTMISSAMILCFVAAPGSANKFGFNLPILRWFGLLSYEWYLFHQPLFYWAWNLFGLSGGDPKIYFLRTAVPTAVSLLIAALIYRYYSLPILRRARG